MTPESPARIWPYLVANLFLAVWLDFTRIHAMLNSDGIIFSLSSLYEWKPFFWEQDRVGMLWPLLFSWSRDPLLTLLLQTGTTTYLGLCMPVLFARVISPHRAGPALAVAASAVAMACGVRDDRGQSILLDNWLVVCNFPGALTLALGAILILDRRGGGWRRWVGRVAAAWALLLAAHWVYPGIILFLVPFVVYRGWLPGPTPAASWWRVLFRPLFSPGVWWYLGGTAVSAAAVLGLMQWVYANDPTVDPTATRELAVERWPLVWGGMIGELFTEPGVAVASVIFGVVAAGGLVWGLWKDRPGVKDLALRAAAVAVAAAGELAFLGTRFWVENNSYHPRYLVAVVTGLTLALLLVGLGPVLRRWWPGRWAGVVAFALLFVASVVQFGWPGPDVPRECVARAAKDLGPEVDAADVDVVAGEYWDCWPLVFHTNVIRYDQGKAPVWGLSLRSAPMRHRWGNPGQEYRVAVPEGERLSYIDRYAGWYGLRRVSDTPVAETSRLKVYVYRAVGP